MTKTILQNSHCVYQGKRIAVYTGELTHKGKLSKKEFVAHPGAVVILPFLDEEHIVMIRNDRFAVSEKLLELPAGTLEPNEQPLTTAERELAEETGYQANKVEPLFHFFPTPGFCNEVMHAFVAHQLKEVGQHLDPTEDITVEIVSWSKALKLISDGHIKDAKSIATLLYYNTFVKNRA